MSNFQIFLPERIDQDLSLIGTHKQKRRKYQKEYQKLGAKFPKTFSIY